MNKKIKVGIIGYGVVGKRRKFHIDNDKRMDVIAICDVRFKPDGTMKDNSESSDYTFAEKKSLENPFKGKLTNNLFFYNNYDLFFNDQILDAVFICVPNYLASNLTIKALKLGMHVFCEKPPGRTVEDIENVIKQEKVNSNLKLKYGFNHRYHGSVKMTKNIIDEKKYGELINIRGVYGKSSVVPFDGEWRSVRKYSGGGILLDQGIHMLDMFNLFCGEFNEIKSFISNSFWSHNVEDNAFAIMRNKEGKIAMIHSSATQWKHNFRLELSFEQGLLQLSGILSGSKSYGQEKLIIVERNNKSIVGSQTNLETIFLNDTSWKEEIENFADLIIHNKEVEIGSSKDALEVMKLVYRIYESDNKWKHLLDIK